MTDTSIRDTLRALRVFDVALPECDFDEAPLTPERLFLRWLSEAIEGGVREPHAMTVSTVDSNGRPNSRVLILKTLDHGKWGFAISRTSRTGHELDATPWAALDFHWREVGRQVRVRGAARDAGAKESRRDYLARPVGSRTQSWVAKPGHVLDRTEDLEAALAQARAKVDADPDAVPPHWTRYDVLADAVEFFQADTQRRHQRLLYTLADGEWRHDRLWP
jgi:pyridoxamine 5'-phosphate oxidase